MTKYNICIFYGIYTYILYIKNRTIPSLSV